MTPEKLFHELLGLGLNWEVIASRFDRESGTVSLEIAETPRLSPSLDKRLAPVHPPTEHRRANRAGGRGSAMPSGCWEARYPVGVCVFIRGSCSCPARLHKIAPLAVGHQDAEEQSHPSSANSHHLLPHSNCHKGHRPR